MHALVLTKAPLGDPDHHNMLPGVTADDVARWNAERVITWEPLPDTDPPAYAQNLPFEGIVKFGLFVDS